MTSVRLLLSHVFLAHTDLWLDKLYTNFLHVAAWVVFHLNKVSYGM